MDNVKQEAETGDPVKTETKRVGKLVMLDRDTFVTMRHLQLQKLMVELDARHNKVDVDVLATFIEELEALPVSEARASLLACVTQQVEKTLKAVKQSVFPGVSVVTLYALELAVAGSGAKIADTDDLGRDQPGDTPELDDDDDPNEAI